jgi:hypothetical protein
MPEVEQPKRRLPSVAINDSLYKKLKDKAAEKGLDLQRYVNDSLEMGLNKDEFLKLYAPHLSKRDIIDNCLIIWDDLRKRAAEVWLREQKLVCDLCQKDDCIHVHFALALPEVAKLTDVNPASKVPFLIKDGKSGKIAKIDYNQFKLYCHLCQSWDCEHVDIARMDVEGKREGKKKSQGVKNTSRQAS